MPALLVLAEDSRGETGHRLTQIAESQNIELQGLPLNVWCRVGRDSTLAVVEDDGRWVKGDFYDRLAAKIEELGPLPRRVGYRERRRTAGREQAPAGEHPLQAGPRRSVRGVRPLRSS